MVGRAFRFLFQWLWIMFHYRWNEKGCFGFCKGMGGGDMKNFPSIPRTQSKIYVIIPSFVYIIRYSVGNKGKLTEGNCRPWDCCLLKHTPSSTTAFRALGHQLGRFPAGTCKHTWKPESFPYFISFMSCLLLSSNPFNQSSALVAC
jgi:hypothetical protein